jgi:hypothetical protein
MCDEYLIFICLRLWADRGMNVMDGIAITILGRNLSPVCYFYVARISLGYSSYKKTKRGMDLPKLLPNLTILVRVW